MITNRDIKINFHCQKLIFTSFNKDVQWLSSKYQMCILLRRDVSWYLFWRVTIRSLLSFMYFDVLIYGLCFLYLTVLCLILRVLIHVVDLKVVIVIRGFRFHKSQIFSQHQNMARILKRGAKCVTKIKWIENHLNSVDILLLWFKKIITTVL